MINLLAAIFFTVGSNNLFAALLGRCAALNKIPICSYKPRSTSGPSYVALLPQPEVEHFLWGRDIERGSAIGRMFVSVLLYEILLWFSLWQNVFGID